jgi:hypothetical protein
MGIQEYTGDGLFSYSITYTTSTYQEKNIYVKTGIYNAQSVSGYPLDIIDDDGDTLSISTSLGIISLKAPGIKIRPTEYAAPTNWSNTQISFGTAIASYDVGSDHYVIGPNNIFKTTDGTTWTTVAVTGLGTTRAFQHIVYGNGKFLAGLSAPVTLNQGLRESTDLVTWTTNTNFGNTSVLGVMYFKNKFTGFGLTGTRTIYKHSTDAITWTQGAYPPITPGTLRPIFANTPNAALLFWGTGTNPIYPRLAETSTPQSSTDGITWTTTATNFSTIRFLSGINDYLVAYSVSGLDAPFLKRFHFSTDAVNWSTVADSFSGTSNLLPAVRTINHSNGFYLYGESNGEITYDRQSHLLPPNGNSSGTVSLGTNGVNFINYSTAQERTFAASITSAASNKEIYPTSAAILLSKGKSENITL